MRWPSRVHCVMLPYRFTRTKAQRCGRGRRAAGVRYDILPIAAPVEGFEALKLDRSAPVDLAEENIQSRTRGTMLMALSNKLGSMLVTTGNKSEVSVGYATLYGDMNGGFNPVKDLYKTELYRLARWRNEHRPPGALGPAGRVIPENVITRAPTAELRENQTDQDSLPPYDTLDAILECLVEEELRLADIVARGFDRATVEKVERMLYLAEYKRRQAAPGVKITRRTSAATALSDHQQVPIGQRLRCLPPGVNLPRASETLGATSNAICIRSSVSIRRQMPSTRSAISGDRADAVQERDTGRAMLRRARPVTDSCGSRFHPMNHPMRGLHRAAHGIGYFRLATDTSSASRMKRW
jgi:NAD+ synthetase